MCHYVSVSVILYRTGSIGAQLIAKLQEHVRANFAQFKTRFVSNDHELKGSLTLCAVLNSASDVLYSRNDPLALRLQLIGALVSMRFQSQRTLARSPCAQGGVGAYDRELTRRWASQRGRYEASARAHRPRAPVAGALLKPHTSVFRGYQWTVETIKRCLVMVFGRVVLQVGFAEFVARLCTHGQPAGQSALRSFLSDRLYTADADRRSEAKLMYALHTVSLLYYTRTSVLYS